MDKNVKFLFAQASNEAVMKGVIEKCFRDSIAETIAEKNEGNENYFPGVFYLADYKIPCMSVHYFLKKLCEYSGYQDEEVVEDLKKSIFKSGKYENEWRNHLLNILKCHHNLLNVNVETHWHINFMPAIYENRHGKAFEVQQLKLHVPTLEELDMGELTERLEDAFRGYSIRQVAFGHRQASDFARRNSDWKRTFR